MTYEILSPKENDQFENVFLDDNYKTTMLKIKKPTLVTIIKTNIFNRKLLSNKSNQYLIIKGKRGNVIINGTNTSGEMQPGMNVVGGGHGENGNNPRKRAV